MEYFQKMEDEVDDVCTHNGIFYVYTSRIFALFLTGESDSKKVWTFKEVFKFDGNHDRTFFTARE